jgi:hypothetical protein
MGACDPVVRAVPDREALVSRTFVQVADTLVADFDIIDLLTVLCDRCVELFDANAVGILLAGHDGVLHVVATSTERPPLLALFRLQHQEGPGLDCFTTGRPVVNRALDEGRWPRFSRQALAAELTSVQALPMRLRDTVVGALCVLLDDRTVLADDDVLMAQALADAATIAIVQDQTAREAALVTGQLQTALHRRVAIEQAKGVLSERAGIGMDEAFRRLRQDARDHNEQLTVVAVGVVDGTLPADRLAHLTR